MTPARKPEVLRLQRTWFAACREAGLDDEGRKAIQLRVAGASSAADMAVRDFNACLIELRRMGWKPQAPAAGRAGSRPMASDPQSAKIRALWLALYHLGEVQHPEESALAAWVKRQTGVDALQFLTGAQAGRMIEIMKKRCARVGYQPAADMRAAKIGLLQAQWRRLTAAGAVPGAGASALDAWLEAGFDAGVLQLDLARLDLAVERLGDRIRKVSVDKRE